MEVGELEELTVSRRELVELTDLTVSRRERGGEKSGLLNGERGAAGGGKPKWKEGLLAGEWRQKEGLLVGEWRRKEGLLESGGRKSEMGKWERER